MGSQAQDLGKTLPDVYNRLLAAYGRQHWWPEDEPFEVIVGAILTQSTAWTNVEKAISNLKAANILNPQSLNDIPSEELARLIRPSGYYNAKALKLKAFARRLCSRYEGDLGLVMIIQRCRIVVLKGDVSSRGSSPRKGRGLRSRT